MSRRDTYYFPHEYNAKDDPKCERLISVMGMEGYGIFWALLEVLRVQPDYTYPLVNIPIVAHKYYTTPEQVRRVVFDFGLFTIIEDKIFFSNGLINRMQVLDERRRKRSEAGKKGMRSRWNNNDDNNVITPLLQPYNSKVNKIKESIDSKGDFKGEPATAVSPDAVAPSSAGEPRKVATKRAAFVAPSLEMVKDYFLTIKGANTDSECFYDYFTANGWRTGKNPIKDWKAAARNWMRRKSEFSNTTQIQTSYETKRIYKDL